jgi:hypothetical protein
MTRAIRLLLEFIVAVLILGIPVYGSWLYYVVTGKYLNF